jgi:hypothetical protein
MFSRISSLITSNQIAPLKRNSAPLPRTQREEEYSPQAKSNLKEDGKRGLSQDGTDAYLDPVLKLGVNAENIVDNLRTLSIDMGRLLNESGYSGILFILWIH